MKYETIRKKAKIAFMAWLDNAMWTPEGQHLWASIRLRMATMSKEEAADLRQFANNFDPDHRDYLALSAKGDGAYALRSRIQLRVREAGLKLIDSWDVRCVGTLIKAMPEIVPKKWHGKPVTCYRADTPSGCWLVRPA